MSLTFLNTHLDDPTGYTFAIIITRHNNQWVFVRHQDRQTWELPAGHVEPGESVYQTAHRELVEETGANNYTLSPLVSYHGNFKGRLIYGMIFVAQVSDFQALPKSEIAEKRLFTAIPESLTYPPEQEQMIDYYLKT